MRLLCFSWNLILSCVKWSVVSDKNNRARDIILQEISIVKLKPFTRAFMLKNILFPFLLYKLKMKIMKTLLRTCCHYLNTETTVYENKLPFGQVYSEYFILETVFFKLESFTDSHFNLGRNHEFTIRLILQNWPHLYFFVFWKWILVDPPQVGVILNSPWGPPKVNDRNLNAQIWSKYSVKCATFEEFCFMMAP